MATALTVLAAEHGFTAGDLNTDGYVAAVPAFQKVYFADGRTAADNGFHKLDFINIKLTFTTPPTGAWEANELITQESTGAKGVYDECIDLTIIGTITGTFIVGEKVEQATTNAVGYVAKANTDATTVYIYPVSGTFTTGAYTITGADSEATLANPSSVSTIGVYHFIYRTTTTAFDDSEITGANNSYTGTPDAVETVPPHWLPWIPTEGSLVDGGSNIGALYMGCIFLNDMFHPNQWICTRQGNPLDFDTSVDESDVGGASSSQASIAGLVGDQIVAFIAYKNYYLIFGCANQMWILRGHPRQGGTISNLTYVDGIFSPESYCWDEFNNLYYVGMTGFYRLPPNVATADTPPENVLSENYPNLIKSLQLNRRTDRVVLQYDKDRKVINVVVCMKDGTWHTGFVYDVRSGGVYPETYPADAIPASMFFHDSYRADLRALLFGGQDGFIRKFDEDTDHDDTAASTTAISSYVIIGPVEMGDVTRGEGRVDEIQIDLSEESSNCDWAVYSGKTAQEVVDLIEAGGDAINSGTFPADIHQNSIRTKIRDQWFAIKLSNATIDKTWAVEGIEVEITPTGKAKS